MLDVSSMEDLATMIESLKISENGATTMQLKIHIPDDLWERLEEVPKAELIRLIRIGKPQR